MGTESGKRTLFSIDQFIILIAWLGADFTILYLKAYEMIIPSIVAFIVLNLALGIWINKTVRPAENKHYRKYFAIQTLFILVWCPLLWLLLFTGRTELIPVWIIILVAFYIGIGVVVFRSVFSGHHRHMAFEHHEHSKAVEHHMHRKKAAKRKKK